MTATSTPRHSLLAQGDPGPLQVAEIGSPAYFGTGSRDWVYYFHPRRALRLFFARLSSQLG
jgi:hypothetical protein